MVEDYNSDWPVEYQKLKTIFQEALGELAVDIQHVGSTSVPGLVAKPALAIDIIIDSKEKLRPGFEKLADARINQLLGRALQLK